MHWFSVWSRPAPRSLPDQHILAEVGDYLLGEDFELPLRLIP